MAEEKPDEAIVVKGQVLDEAGKPVNAAHVYIPTIVIEQECTATTDSDGRFELRLKSDFRAFRFCCIATSADRSRQGFVQADPRDKEIPDSVVITLKPAREITAVVSNSDGKPVAHADVLGVNRSFVFVQTQSDETGRAVLLVPEGLLLESVAAIKSGAGVDYFRFDQTSGRARDPGWLPEDFDQPLAFTLRGARAITVKVTDSQGKPVPEARIYPRHFNLAEKGGYLNLNGYKPRIQWTNENGTASYDYFPANHEGLVIFGTIKDQYKSERTNFNPASLSDQVDVTLDKLMPAPGRVIDVDGQPVAGATIAARGGSHDIDSYFASATSDENGHFELMLAPNHYYMFRADKEKLISSAVCFVVRDKPPLAELVLRLKPATRVFGRVTVGKDWSPQSGQRVYLRQDAEPDYYKLPEESRLPNPTNSRYGVSTGRGGYATTDKQGRFEFWVGPGKFMLMGPKETEAQEFVIDDQQELEFHLHAERPERILMKGRVVFRDNPEKPLANAKVVVHSDGAAGVYTSPVYTDEAGRFEINRPYAPCISYVKNEEGSYAAITRIELEQKQVQLELIPTSTASGRLTSSASDEPWPGEEIQYGMRVYDGESGQSPFMVTFGGSAVTAADGTFELTGLLPGFEYEINVVTERDNDGRAFSWRGIRQIELDKIGDVELGEVMLSPKYEPPTLEKRIERWFANDAKLSERVLSKLRDARLGHQHLIAMITSQDHPFCRKFFETKYDYKNPDRNRLYAATSNFEMFAIQPQRLQQTSYLPVAMAELGKSLAESDTFVLGVFTKSGELLGTAHQADLETGGELDFEKMYAFLNRHQPDLPDAQAMVEAAFEKARRENKQVLWQHSGAFCGPCILLSRYLDKHRELIEKDYVWVKVDRRYAHGQEMVDKYRSEGGGIPWFVIMDADGKQLINSTSEEGNIGYPASDIGREHFGKMLRETAQRLTADEINELLEDLKK